MPIVVAQHGVSGSESLPIAARAAGLAARHSRFPAAHGIHVDPEPDTRGAATALGSSRVIYPQPALASTSASFLVAQSALSPAAALVHASLAGSDLLSSIIFVLVAPIPILVSLFLAWLTHLPDRSRPYSRQDGYGQHPQGKANRNPQRRHLRRQHWLMVAAHVLLIATSLNFLLTATLGFLKVLVHIGILSLASSTESHPQLLSKEVVLGMLNGIASVTAQTTGEAALVYQFARIYPSSSARWRILPMALLFILVRLTAHVSLNTLVIWSIVDPSVSATLRSYQRIAAACFSSSVTAITLLLSATFVHKLSSRWRRHVASQLNAAKSRGLESSAEPLSPTMQRIRAILVASWHHTVLTSIFSLAMTASFPFAQSSNAAYWINLVATTAFKLSFSLGISRSLYHMAYDSVLRHQIQFLATVNPQSRGARGELRRDCEERARRRRRRRAEQPGHGEVQEGVRLSLSSSAASSFIYNSWGSADSDSDRHEEPDSGTETDIQVVVDTAIPPSEWPISTENIETDPHVLSPSGLGGNALPLSPAAVEATSLAVPNHASPSHLSKQSRSRALSTGPPVWDTFVVTPHHQEPWPIRSSVIESDPGHSHHCSSSATHAVPKDKKPQEVIDSSDGKRPAPAKRINLAMNSLRGPQEVVDHFSEYVCHRFATHAQFFPASLVRESHIDSTTTIIPPPPAASCPAPENDSTTTLPPHQPLSAASSDSNEHIPAAQQPPSLPAEHAPGARLCYQTMMEVLSLPPAVFFASRRATGTKEPILSDTAGTAKSTKPVLFLPVHFNGRKLGVFVLAPWDPPGKLGKSFGARTVSAATSASAPDGRRTRSRAGSQQRPDSGLRAVSDQLVQGPLNDPAVELVKQLVRFFAAYYYSAQERQLNQETMRKFQERLAVMEATANAKSTFLANMSHEIRTPAAQVIQAVHMLSETDLNSIQREHVQVIIRSSELLLAILNDVLDLSKLENGKIRFENRTFDLHEALRQSVDAYTNPRKPVDVGCVMDRALPQFVVGDVVRLRQIFNNLLSNAVKFTNVGHVLLRAMLVSMDSTSARVRFSVQDTGCGIPQDRLASIFERFEQSDETITRLYGGTGLGLSICQSLCTLMNSSLEVTSELNRGSDFSFEVSLPFAPPDHIVPPHIHSPPPPILDPTAPPRLIRLVICTGPAAERPPQLPPAALRGTSSRVVATNSGSSNVLSGKSRPHDVMNDLLANYGIVVATVYTTCNALMDSANATGTGPKPNIVVITCPKRWPPIPPAPPRLPTVIVSGCDMLASADGGPTLVPPHSPYSNLAYVARPFKQTHLYRVLDTVAGLGDALPLSTLINGHSGGDSALVAEPPPIPRSPNAGSVVGGADTKADVDPQFNRLPSPTCACDGSAATGAPHNAPSVIASDLSSTAHTAAGSGLVAGGYAPLRVLVVDDNPLNRKLMQAMVAKLGHEVELAENGKVAVDRVLAMPAASIGDPEADGPRVEANEDDTGVANVDCIFMDVRMPVLDGLEATRLIVAHFDSLPDPAQRAKRPVIFGLSADALQESEETGLFHGMDVYLRKPLLRKDIETALNQYFGPNGLRHKKQP